MLKAAVFGLVLVALVLPASAGAEFGDGSRTNDLVSSRPGDEVAAIGFADRPCVDKDFHGADHHGDADVDDIAEQAETWEKYARQAEGKGDHELAAKRYAYAACLWDSVSEFDNADAAYEKAAEQYDQAASDAAEAGDEAKAAELKEEAEKMRGYLR